MPERDPELQRLIDEREIRDVIARFCRGVDRRDEALIASVYHPDGVDDHGVFQGNGAEFARLLPAAMERSCDASQHLLGQSMIDLRGDEAHAETYVIAVHRKGTGAEVTIETFGARYLDRFTRRGGEWKISERVVVGDWARVEEGLREPPLAARLAQGLHGADDLAFRRDGSLLDDLVRGAEA